MRTSFFKAGVGVVLVSMAIAGAANAQVSSESVVSGAPDVYLVKKGDTLWRISGMYLKDASLWPRIWKMNAEIKNPHLIYPGDKIIMKSENGKVTLHLDGYGDEYKGVVEVLSPIPSVDVIKQPLRAIPSDLISHFFGDSTVHPVNFSKGLMAITSSRDSHWNLSQGSTVYAQGLVGPGGSVFAIVRSSGHLIDPITGKMLGEQMMKVGELRIIKEGTASSPAKLLISKSRQEIHVGDLIAELPSIPSYVFHPRPHAGALKGVVVSIGGGAQNPSLGKSPSLPSEVGPYSVVVLNKGKSSNVTKGDVFSVSQKGMINSVRSTFGYRNGVKVAAPLFPNPNEVIGSVMVYEVFDELSYAIIMGGERPISPGDTFSTPNKTIEKHEEKEFKGEPD